MRLLIADKLHPRAVDELRTLPLDVDYEPDLTKDTLEQRISEAGILVVRSTEVTQAAIDAAKSLHLIIRAGAEYQTIDVRAASRRGIYVARIPGKNASAVAELVMGHIINLDRRVIDAAVSLREGRWERSVYGRAEGLYGKSIGIAGLGAIGKEVAYRARAFGMNVVAWSRGLSPLRASDLGVAYAGSIEELASRSHVLTVHLPLTDRTRHIVNARVFSQLPVGSIFVNAARADLVDLHAMREAVAKRSLRVGLDVYHDEPKGLTSYKTDLFEPVPGGGLIYGTPHIAASTDQAQLAIAVETVHTIRSFLLQGVVPHVANVSHSSAARFQLVIRMIDRVGTFANVLSVIKRHSLNLEEVTNTVFEGGEAACAKLRVLTRPSESCLSEIRAFEEVLHVDVVPLPNLA